MTAKVRFLWIIALFLLTMLICEVMGYVKHNKLPERSDRAIDHIR